MGRSTTPKYRLEIFDQAGWHKLIWRGKASERALEDYVFKYAKSLEHGGVNAHVSKSFGYIPYPSAARIVEQRSGDSVVTWRAGRFQSFGEAIVPKFEQMSPLEVRRYDAAVEAFENAPLEGLETYMEEADSWTEDGDFWLRKVYWLNEDPGGPSTKGSFGVQFAPNSDKIVDMWWKYW